MSKDYFQYAYVTNDLDRAVAEIRELQDLGPFQEIRDLELQLGAGRECVCHFALAFKADMQFEVIEPVSGDVSFYREILPANGYATRFHHLGRFFASMDDYETALATARARWDIPISGAVFGGFFAYANARADIGHHLEFFSFPGDAHLKGVPRY